MTKQKRAKMKKQVKKYKIKPLFSIISTVQSEDPKLIERCIQSLKNQIYPQFEFFILLSSNRPRYHQLLNYEKEDERIKIRTVDNETLITRKNKVLEEATGDFIAFIHIEDELSEDALVHMSDLINEQPEADMIYSDEDQMKLDGTRHTPFFKPDWSPDTFLTYPYIGNLSVYRTSLVRELKGLRKGFKGIEHFDLVLRLSEMTERIYHIPKILYHQRSEYKNKKKSNSKLQQKAIRDALVRRNEHAAVSLSALSQNHTVVQYDPLGFPLISILLPTKDKAELVDQCLSSIFSKTTYPNFEIIIIDNGSVEPDTFQLIDIWIERYPTIIRSYRLDIPYNWSELNNKTSLIARGELLLFLNNDTEVITSNWLEEMAGQALRPRVGAVGVKLLYFDHTIQHAGVVLGIHGLCDHSDKGKKSDYEGYYGRLLGPSNFSAVTGACLMVRKEVFDEVGGLDENLAIEFNDVDFCLKLLHEGYYNVLLPQVVLYHHESKTRGIAKNIQQQEVSRKEAKIVKNRWKPYILKDPFYNENLELSAGNFDIFIELQKAIEMSHFVVQEIDNQNVIGHFNGQLTNEMVELFGWAINQEDSPRKMDILVTNQDKLVIAYVKIDRRRLDIAEKFGNQQYLYSGFRTKVRPEILPYGDHTLTAWAYFPEQRVAVELAGNFELER